MQRSCVTPFRERGRSTHMEYRQLPDSLIKCTICWPHQRNQKGSNTTPEGMSWYLFIWCNDSGLSLEQRWKKGRFAAAVSCTLREKMRPGTAANCSTCDTTGETRNKADCFPLLRRITRLKTVNSEVKSVNSLPKRGSLQWVHGTMLEPPWKSH